MNTGLFFAIASPFLSSIATVFKGGAVKLLNPLVVLAFSSLIGGIILLFFLLLRRQKINFKAILKNKADFLSLVLTRQILGEVLFTVGLGLTDAIKAIFFTKVEPYFVLYWHWMLRKEKIKRSHLVLLAIHITGAILLSTGGKFMGFGKPQVGDLFIIAAMGLFSLSYLPASKLSKRLGAVQTNSSMLLIAGLLFLPLAVIFSESRVWNLSLGWGYLLGHTVIFATIGLTFWFASLKTVKGWMVSALRSLGPLLGAPVAFLFLGETLTSVQLIGGAIVLTTSFLIAKEHLDSAKK